MLLSRRLQFTEKSPLRKLGFLIEEARRNPDVISFGGGAPSLPPPLEVLEGIKQALTDDPWNSTTYTDTKGMNELLELISQDLKKHSGLDVDPGKEILLTDGATEGIFLSLMAVLNEGDEVILTDPTYLGYFEAVEILGGRLKRLPVHISENFQPDIERLKHLISDKTKAFILLSPDNPTGRIIRKDIAKAIVDLANDHNFWIICDDSYRHILYEGEHVWISSLPNAWERVITLCSFSKEASLPGLRLGYAYGPEEVISSMEKLKQYTSFTPSTIGQLAAIKFLSGGVKERYLREVVIPTYKSRRDYMYECIKEYLPNAVTVKPAGAFYFFINMERYLSNLDDEEFSMRLLREEGVVVVPGSFFGESGSKHLRLTFVSSDLEQIKKGVMKISKFVSKLLKQKVHLEV